MRGKEPRSAANRANNDAAWLNDRYYDERYAPPVDVVPQRTRQHARPLQHPGQQLPAPPPVAPADDEETSDWLYFWHEIWRWIEESPAWAQRLGLIALAGLLLLILVPLLIAHHGDSASVQTQTGNATATLPATATDDNGAAGIVPTTIPIPSTSTDATATVGINLGAPTMTGTQAVHAPVQLIISCVSSAAGYCEFPQGTAITPANGTSGTTCTLMQSVWTNVGQNTTPTPCAYAGAAPYSYVHASVPCSTNGNGACAGTVIEQL
jgi:hypothetical protein